MNCTLYQTPSGYFLQCPETILKDNQSLLAALIVLGILIILAIMKREIAMLYSAILSYLVLNNQNHDGLNSENYEMYDYQSLP